MLRYYNFQKMCIIIKKEGVKCLILLSITIQ